MILLARSLTSIDAFDNALRSISDIAAWTASRSKNMDVLARIPTAGIFGTMRGMFGITR
jgi:hypothetical protein